MNKEKLLISVFLMLFLMSAPGCTNDFNDGADAYKRKDYKTAFEKWKPLAEQGNDDAQYKLGKMYREGLGVTQDYVQAYKWYNIVAQKGYGGGYKYMTKIEKYMTPAQIAEAQKLAREWMESHGK